MNPIPPLKPTAPPGALAGNRGPTWLPVMRNKPSGAATTLASLAVTDNLSGRLWALARNLWWTWHPEVAHLFQELDPRLWRSLDHNPIAMLSQFTPEVLEERAMELALHSRINHAYRRLCEYLDDKHTWGATHAGVLLARPVAYFSAEFGLHEGLPIYSGGLGVLAGDHVKSASDLGVPIVGIGLLYDQGYFLQRLDRHGWQQQAYVDVNINHLPIEPAKSLAGLPVVVRIETRDGVVSAQVWELRVGRARLLLLDSDVDGNRMEDRELTSRLYGGDIRIRIRQELLLGVGGVRALEAMAIVPGALHLNEGHSAFACLEMVRQRMFSEKLSFEEAVRQIAAMIAFTTHTPVDAGHDRFPSRLIEEHLGPLGDALGLSHEALMGLGRIHTHDHHEPFCMTTLALKLSRRANAVSCLHGTISRRMWKPLWPERVEEDVPIGHITNGVHVPSWLAPQMYNLFDRQLGKDWVSQSGEPELWRQVERIDDGELWETHQVLKTRLLEFVRRRMAEDRKRRNEPAEAIDECQQLLNSEILTIGFARRFATYKRAPLILSDFERILGLLNHPSTPIQLVFAGKAHPADEPGKRLLFEIAQRMRDARYKSRLTFVEDYDINVGRHLVQGVDVWLNTPRRPLEASGTSGQKVVLNGGLNLSILDGWWAEAYDGSNGFAIGKGTSHVSTEIEDRRDADSLYRVLEEKVIPLYYHRDAAGLPLGWIARMKRSIRTLGWRFNADRMVMDYVRCCYLPAVGGVSRYMHPKH